MVLQTLIQYVSATIHELNNFLYPVFDFDCKT